jgi:hypothetical protein
MNVRPPRLTSHAKRSKEIHEVHAAREASTAACKPEEVPIEDIDTILTKQLSATVRRPKRIIDHTSEETTNALAIEQLTHVNIKNMNIQYPSLTTSNTYSM